MFDFNGKIIVVTGAAGNLGQAVVRAFLDQGGSVCALDYQMGRLTEVFTDIQDPNLKLFEEVDVTDLDSLKAISGNIHDYNGNVDVLVNTVGGFSSGEPVHELSASTWRKMLNLNVISFINCSKIFIPDMLEKNKGKVITIGAKSSLKGGAKSGAYAASKAALLRLTESMAEELKSHNIQVNCVLPSTIDTPQNRDAMPQADFSKWVSPGKIAEVILFLCSSAAEEITGAAIPVYGST